MKSKLLSCLRRLLLATSLTVIVLAGYVALDSRVVLPAAGQPLMDLVKANASGYLTDEEFGRLKRQLFYRL